MVEIRTRLGRAAIAVLAVVPASAAAQPPPVEVAPLVVAADPEGAIARGITELVSELGRAGYFAAAPAGQARVPADCALDDPERERCFAEAARDAGVPNLVFVIAEPSDTGVRVTCVADDSARSQQADVPLPAAAPSDPAAVMEQRVALTRCIIGALHAPLRA